MLIFQMPPRTMTIHGTPSFPCEACVEADMSPKELFGLEQLSGRLPLMRPGAEATMRPDLKDGGVFLSVAGRLERLRLDARFCETTVHIEDGHLRASWTCTSLENLRDTIVALNVALPAALSSAVPSPVQIGDLTGTVGDAGVTYEFRGKTEHEYLAVTGALLAESMAQKLAAFGAASDVDNIGLLTSASRYLQQAKRLRYVSDFSTEFIGERLLNLYKAIEVVFGRSADSLRKDLAAIDVPTDVVEGIFVALLYVRDELDVGHPALRALAPADWERMHTFADHAEAGVTWLLAKVTGAVAAKSFKLRRVEGSAGKRGKLLQTLATRSPVRVDAYGGDAVKVPRTT